MSDSDNPATGPLTIDQALDKFEATAEATTAEEVTEEPTETVVEETVSEAEEPVEAEADAEEAESEVEEPTDEGDEQTLTLAEYGEVRVQMGDEVVTLSEIAERVEKGTLRQQDYTRKTMQLAEERKSLEAERAELAEKQQQLDQALLSAQGEEAEPDWEQVFDEDPIDGPRQKVIWEKQKAAKDRARAEAQARIEAADAERFQTYTAKVLQAIPEWATPGAFEAGEAERKAIAEELGFTDAEYRGTADPRVAHAFELLVRARKAEAAAKAKVDVAEKKIGKAPKVLKPGTAKAKADRKAEEKAAVTRKLSRPHSIEEHLKALGVS